MLLRDTNVLKIVGILSIFLCPNWRVIVGYLFLVLMGCGASCVCVCDKIEFTQFTEWNDPHAQLRMEDVFLTALWADALDDPHAASTHSVDRLAEYNCVVFPSGTPKNRRLTHAHSVAQSKTEEIQT